MAFTCFNRNISDEAHDKIKELGPSGMQAFAFTPSGGWVIVTNGGVFARSHAVTLVYDPGRISA